MYLFKAYLCMFITFQHKILNIFSCKVTATPTMNLSAELSSAFGGYPQTKILKLFDRG